MNDTQTWALIALLAGMMLTLFLEVRGDRKELRAGLDALRIELSSKIGAIGSDVSELKVTVARIDERLKGLEARYP